MHLPDVLHCETIADRSVLHDWELAPHRHARLHQVLLIEAGGGTATLDGKKEKLKPGALVNVPPGHVHAFKFERNTHGWVTTLADELMDELLVGAGTLRTELDRACVLSADAFMLQNCTKLFEIRFSGFEPSGIPKISDVFYRFSVTLFYLIIKLFMIGLNVLFCI